jgi:uncharacterized hydrophobic protein (TIGR00271 family)
VDEAHKPISESIQESATERLGVRRWDLPAIYRDSAEAATDNGLPYWSVLALSGAIATLGLALNSSAVVIGAMLVAPLLAPIVGLALALAVGDIRLAIQTGAVVAASTLCVAAIGALLTAVLPFQTITLEISARARPSTIDLAIAIFSGLVGAVVTVARGSRLSAAIPGVAISVALIPPLAVSGFGLAADRNVELMWGSLLLYGANLAGIVLSGMAVFLLVGMHCEDVVEAARRWHGESVPRGLSATVDRIPWVRRLEIRHSPWSRMGLVVAFVVALGIPLTQTLVQIARDARVERAVGAAAERFEVPGRTSILSREIVYGSGQSRVYLRIATTRWFGDEAREEFEKAASARAGEPVRLVLEQLPTSAGDVEELARMLPGRTSSQPRAPTAARLGDLLALARTRLEEVDRMVSLPDSVWLAGLELATADDGSSTLRATYLAPAPLPDEASQMLAAQLDRVLDVPDLRVLLVHLPPVTREVASPADTTALREIVELLRTNGRLHVEVVGGEESDTAAALSTVETLARMGVARGRVSLRLDGAGPLYVHLRPAQPAAGGGGPPEPPDQP